MKDNTLHSQVLGEGMPLVILHGFLGMSDNWKSLGMQYAEEGFEVHLIDLRNHGRSFHSEKFSYEIMVQDLKNYCGAHSLKKIFLIGHSMGGKVAMLFATQYPEKVKKLLIADIGPKEYPPHHHDILNALEKIDLSEIGLRTEADDILSKYLEDEGVRLFLLKNLFRKTRTEFGWRMNLPILSEKMEAIGEALPQDAVYNGATLFLRGDKSGYIKDEDKSLIEKHFPDVKIETVREAGHWLHAENPEMFYNLSMKFFKE